MQKRKLLYTSLASLALATLASQTSLADELGTVDTLTLQPVETMVADTGEQAKAEPLTPEAPIAYSTEQSHADKITEVIRNRIQNGTLAFHIHDHYKNFAPIIIEGEEGTEINVTRTIGYVAMVPKPVKAPISTTNGSSYDFGSLDDSMDTPRVISYNGGLFEEVINYSKSHQFFKPDQAVLSGLEKKLADYGLRLEVEDSGNRLGSYIDDSRLDLQHNFQDYLYFSQTYRITGTLKRPDGIAGPAETSWKNTFYNAQYNQDFGTGENLPTVPLYPGSDYSDLSYNFTYTNTDNWAALQRLTPRPPEKRWGSINFGVEEIPLITTVKVKSAQPLAELYDLQATNTTVRVDTPIDPSSLITNKADLPADTQFTWIKTPDTHLAGTSGYARIRATFSDGSQKEVRVRISVQATQAQINTPEGASRSFLRNSPVSPEDLIKNKDSLPQGTRFSWSLQPNLTTPGGKLAKIRITYPDGSFEEVPLRFTIR